MLQATGDDYTVLMLWTVGFYVVAAVLSWMLLRPVERAMWASDSPAASGTARVRPAQKSEE